MPRTNSWHWLLSFPQQSLTWKCQNQTQWTLSCCIKVSLLRVWLWKDALATKRIQSTPALFLGTHRDKAQLFWSLEGFSSKELSWLEAFSHDAAKKMPNRSNSCPYFVLSKQYFCIISFLHLWFKTLLKLYIWNASQNKTSFAPP